MDKDGPEARHSYSFGDTRHPGQYALVSIRWSQDNVAALRSIYGTGAPGTATAVQGGAATERNAAADGQIRLGELLIHDVGHAWPAGTGRPNSADEGGVWMAQSGLDYPRYIAGWLMRHNMRAGGSQVIVDPPTVSDNTLAVTGTTADSGQIVRVGSTLLQADRAGDFQPVDGHERIASAAGSFSDRYAGLAEGRYRVTITATNDAGRTTSRTSDAVPVGTRRRSGNARPTPRATSAMSRPAAPTTGSASRTPGARTSGWVSITSSSAPLWPRRRRTTTSSAAAPERGASGIRGRAR